MSRIPSEPRSRRCQRPWAPWAIALLCLAGAGLAPAAVRTPVRRITPAPPGTAPALAVQQSEHYTVHSDLPAARAADLARHMDAIFKEYERRFATLGVERRPGRLGLYLLARQRDYLALIKAQGVDATNTGGMFVTRRGMHGLAVWVEDRTPWDVRQTLQHEGFHQFASLYLGWSLPPWLDEGLAGYFQEGILASGRLTLGRAPGPRILSVQQALKAGTAVAFTDLVAMDKGAFADTLRRDSESGARLYDQVWSMVHFLLHSEGGKHQPAFEKMLQAISRGQPVARAFPEAFGAAAESFAEPWRKYITEAAPDPLSVTMDRMFVLGQALRFLKDLREPNPASIDDLQRRLSRVGYQITRTVRGVKQQSSARDAAFYAYPRPDGSTARFELLEAGRDDLPPRITAPHSKPAAEVVWSRGPDRKLVMDYQFK